MPDQYHRTTVAELDDLVAETHQLWDEEWVGFSWRNYTHEHMRRVRGLAGTLAGAEGADPHVVALAATLHDVTKSYDGEILTGSDGKRIIDANGFWRNETLAPARSNAVTEIYDQLGLSGSVHHVSGGAVARVLLERRGFGSSIVDEVEQAERPGAAVAASRKKLLSSRECWAADTSSACFARTRDLNVSYERTPREVEPEIIAPMRALERYLVDREASEGGPA
mgnify:CR=1 FL=1